MNKLDIIADDPIGDIGQVWGGPKVEHPYHHAALVKWGMPENTNRTFVCVQGEALARRYGREFRDYRLFYFGIPVKECPIDTGYSVQLFEKDPDDLKDQIVVWARTIVWRDYAATYDALYYAKGNTWAMGLNNLHTVPTPAGRKEVGKKLADGFHLGETPVFSLARKKSLKLSADQFLDQGLKAAEMAARAGVRTFGYKQLAPYFKKLGFISDRETIRDHAFAYPAEWEKIQQKFEETWEWRRANDPKAKATLAVRNMRNLR
jgi:hypothetical protein